MKTFYIHQTELEGVYSVSTNRGSAVIAEFETGEVSPDAILRAADQHMASAGNLSTDIQVTFYFDVLPT